MPIKHTLLLGAAIMAMAPSSWAAEERLQIGLYAPEKPTATLVTDPKITSLEWSQGDLRIQFDQSAPCGDYMPGDPVWTKAGATVVLNFDWVSRFPETAPAKNLCLKHVQAWVFRVPRQDYTVLFADSVPRFEERLGTIEEIRR